MPIEDVLVDGVAVSKAALRAFIRDMDIDTIIVGDETGTAAVTALPMKVIGGDSGISMVATNTAANTESFLAAFQKDDVGNYKKWAVIAFTVPDRDDQAGYGGANLHLTKLTAGVAADDLIWFAGGGKGIKIFPSSLTAGDLPGDKIMAMLGSLSVGTGFTFTAPQVNQIVGQNSQHSGVTLINNSTQNAASERLILGNNASAAGFTAELFGGNHATKPSYAEIVQQFNAPLSLGSNGILRVRLPADGGLAVQDGITAPATAAGWTIIYVDTADGDLKVKFGDGTVKTLATDT